MRPDRWRQVEQLYHSALEREEPARHVFLHDVCRDDEELRREVQSLLDQPDSGMLNHPLQLGPYQIVGLLGAGGMGTVYQARDTRLNRIVAIKVSDARFSNRFEREARAVAALNHPHICTLYDVGPNYLVMEYVEGEPLEGPMPVTQALRLAIQMADALQVAHAKGIIHRDLKPGNVLVTRSGVKILDFGLAKIEEPSPGDEESTRTHQPRTEQGTIVGTTAYMSPEQAQAKPVDARSDVFSFGAVLYEMLTGKRAFRGDTKLSILSAILKEEPEPVSSIRKGIPPELGRIIARCLRKDPERRFQHMDDVRVALEEVKEESDSGQLLGQPAAPGPRRRWVWALGIAGVVLLGTGLWFMREPASPVPQQTLVHVTTYPGSEMYPSFSPDGKQVAFYWDGEKSANPGIYVKLLGENDALRLTTGRDAYPAWAPDGNRIAFVRGEPNRGIYTVSALGGTERKLSSLAPTDQISWSPDGKWLALSLLNEKDRGILLLPAEGGEPRRISNPKAPAFDRAPAFSPDGERLGYAGCTHRFFCEVYVQALGSGYSLRGGPRPVTRKPDVITGLTWSRDGGSLIYAGPHDTPSFFSYLWRVEADGRQAPQRLELAGPLAYSPSVSPTANRLVFFRLLYNNEIWRYRPGHGMEPLIASSLGNYGPQFSPDGSRIAFESARSGEASEIWVAQADGSKPVQMTNLLGRYQSAPSWSPDGRWIAFHSQGQDGNWHIYAIEAAGGSSRRITSGPSDDQMPSWSRDGRWIYFRSDRAGSNEIWRVPFAGGPPEQVTTRGGYIAYESADGKMLFYTKGSFVGTTPVPSGPLFARRLSGGEEQEVLPYTYESSFLPVADGIYYIGRRSDEGYYPLEFFQFSSTASRLVTKIEGSADEGLSVSPDRKTILFAKSVSAGANLMMIENFR
jgi:eukaryotic-like serine/threonine-protein kinase